MNHTSTCCSYGPKWISKNALIDTKFGEPRDLDNLTAYYCT